MSKRCWGDEIIDCGQEMPDQVWLIVTQKD
jgi:hypothetical protein